MVFKTEGSIMRVSIAHHMFRKSGETTQRDDWEGYFN